MKFSNSLSRLFFVLIVIFLSGGPATAAERSGSVATLMEEVEVTARRKSNTEKIQDIPVAVSAFTGDQIEAMFASDLNDITASVPNAAAIENNSFPNYVNFFVRGIGVAGTVISDDPTTGVFVDGVYQGISAGVLLDTFDLESVEILRGPQGTLFGRNVTGGAAVINTLGPTEQCEGRVRLMAGNDGAQELSLRYSGPMVEDKLLGKAAVFYKANDDWADNPSGNAAGFDDLGEREQVVVRGGLTWLISDTVTADFRVESGDSEDDPLPISAIDNTALLGAQPIPGLSEVAFEDSDDPIANGVNTDPVETEWSSASVEINWDLGKFNLKSITGWRDYEQNGLAQDFDGSTVALFDVNNSFIEQDQISQEFLLNIDVSDNVSLTTGLFYFDQSWEYGERRFGALFGAAGGLHAHATGDHQVTGLFAQADIGFGDSWTLTLGGRYSQEDKDVAIGQFGAGLVDGTFNCTDLVGTDPRDCPPNFFGDEDWSSFSPKVGIQYVFDDDTQAYASWTRGFRSGGFNIRQNVGVVPGPYDEETVDAFEVGLKSDFADGNLRTNISLFMNEFEDLQRTVVNQDGFQSVTNAAEAEISGAELELSWLIGDAFLLQLATGYIDAELQNFVNPRGGPGGAPLVINGTSLPFVPEWQHKLNLTYDVALGNNDLTFRAGWQFFDETQSTDDNLGFPSDDFSSIDLSVSYANADSDWQVTLFGKNIEDEIRNEQITSAINPGWILTGSRNPARYGIEFIKGF